MGWQFCFWVFLSGSKLLHWTEHTGVCRKGMQRCASNPVRSGSVQRCATGACCCCTPFNFRQQSERAVANLQGTLWEFPFWCAVPPCCGSSPFPAVECPAPQEVLPCFQDVTVDIIFWIRVPPHAETAPRLLAWMFAVSKQRYRAAGIEAGELLHCWAFGS